MCVEASEFLGEFEGMSEKVGDGFACPEKQGFLDGLIPESEHNAVDCGET